MTEKPAGEVIHDAVTGQDKPIEKKSRTTASLVFLTYPLLLVIAILLAIWYFSTQG